MIVAKGWVASDYRSTISALNSSWLQRFLGNRLLYWPGLKPWNTTLSLAPDQGQRPYRLSTSEQAQFALEIRLHSLRPNKTKLRVRSLSERLDLRRTFSPSWKRLEVRRRRQQTKAIGMPYDSQQLHLFLPSNRRPELTEQQFLHVSRVLLIQLCSRSRHLD